METSVDSDRLARIEEMLLRAQNSDRLPMNVQRIKNPKAWVESGKTYSTIRARKQALAYYAIANGKVVETEIHPKSHREVWKFESVLKAVEELLSEIVTRKITINDTVQVFMKYLEQEDFASWTRTQYRSYLPEFFICSLGPKNFSREEFDLAVPSETPTVETKKKIPVMDGVRSMISYATPEYRAMIGTFANIGWRIEEILSRKWSDLKIRPEGYGRLEIRAKETKAKYDRVAFLTPEVVNWLKQFHELLPEKSQWLFPGYKGDHLNQQAAEYNLKRLFKKAGMLDDEDAIYSSHSFRTFADGLLSKATLDRRYIELTIGHKSSLGAGINYKDFDAIEEQWKERCLHALTIEKKFEFHTAESERIRQLESEKEGIIAFLAQSSGMSIEQAKQAMQEAKVRYHIALKTTELKVVTKKQLEDKSAEQKTETP